LKTLKVEDDSFFDIGQGLLVGVPFRDAPRQRRNSYSIPSLFLRFENDLVASLSHLSILYE